MCGIAGLLNSAGIEHSAPPEVRVKGMVDELRHRGPDDQGVWAAVHHRVALGHARLSILDLSAGGRQPMLSRCERYVAVFNGEIYNFRRIRARLEATGRAFRGESDTEVLVESVAAWGVEEAVAQAVGMFAFAIWDRQERALVLGRDRLGEKPLYYGWIGDDFAFASELKALRSHPAWRGTVDRGALTLFLRHSYVPGPRTIYEGILKLQPGCLLRIVDFVPGRLPEPESYWSIDAVSRGPADPLPSGDEGAVEELERLLRQAVRDQMVADVPLGAFLSGGVDSATVVALMQAESDRPVRTFTIGVQDPAHDEAAAARAIAAHLGTEHTEQYVRPEDALAVIPRLSSIYDEPFADSSQIPTLLVSELARRSVTVSLSGDGGDELFGGYERYVYAPGVVRRLGLVPGPLRRQVGRALLASPVLGGIGRLRQGDGGLLVERTERLGEVLGHHSPLAVHRALHSSWARPEMVVRGGEEYPTPLTTPGLPWSGRGFAERMLIADALTYLPDDLLVKADRAAMAVSLETRVPMLDHRVVEFAFRLPWQMKVRGGTRKWILRQVLHRHVPRHLVDGPKKGFSVPIGAWLRGPLREWADRLLDTDRIDAEGYFHPEPIAHRWAEHRKGTCDWSYPLWAVLMFQAWNEVQAR